MTSAPDWKLCKQKDCLATICDAWFDRGGLTDAALNEIRLIKRNENKIPNPGLIRTILTRRTAQSLARLEQAVTAVLAYVGGWKNISRPSLSEKVEALRDKAGDPIDYYSDEDDWQPLVDKFESNIVDIAAIWAPEMASPGCATLEELAELRFSFVSSYAHTFEYMVERYPDFVAPKLVPENTFEELCAELGAPADILPSAPQTPEDSGTAGGEGAA